MDALNLLLVGVDRKLSADIAARLDSYGDAVALSCEAFLENPHQVNNYGAVVIALTTSDGHSCLDAITQATRNLPKRVSVLALVEAPADRSLERAMTSAEIRGASLALPLPADGSEIVLGALKLASKGQSLSPELTTAAARWREAAEG